MKYDDDRFFEDEEIEAMNIIRNYLNKSNDKNWSYTYISENYNSAVKRVIKNLATIEKSDYGISSKSQGDRSINYKDDAFEIIDSIVKTMLPKPFLKMRVW